MHVPGHLLSAWSIPAGAGEPVALMVSVKVRRVYPRGCGGTLKGELHVCSLPGLSPRVRGNQSQLVVLSELKRSIPAGAGEPLS